MLENSSYHIPFTAQVGELGLKEAHGIIQFSPKRGLIIEFQLKDAIVGLIKSDVKTVAIQWQDLVDFQVKKKLFGAYISIRVNKMSIFEDLPSSNAGELIAKIKKSYVEQAKNLQSSLLLMISEKKIELLDQLNEE